MAKSFTSVPGSMTKIRTEQIKSELALGTLSGDIAAITQSFADIVGGDWNSDLSGYQDVQLLDLAAQINAGTSGLFKVKVAAEVTGTLSASLGVTAAKFDAAGLAHVGSAQVDNLNVAGGVVFTDASGNLDNDAKVAWNGSKLAVDGEVSGSGALNVGGAATIGGAATFNGLVDVNAGMSASFIKIDGDVAQRLYIVDADGSMKDESKLVFDGSKLAVTGIVSGSLALQGASVAVDGAASVGGTLTVTSTSQFNDNVTIASGKSLTVGGDLIVNGTTTTVNSTTVSIDDKNIELGSVSGSMTDAFADGGGITLKGDTDHTIIWRDSQDAWEFSEHLVPAGVKDLGLTGDRWQNLWLAGNADIDGTADIAGTLAVGGIATFSAAITGSAGLEITGQMSGSSALLVGGAATVGNGLTVNGAAADFNAGVTANQIKIDGDTQQRLYVVDAAGAMKDEPGLLYNFVDLMTVSGSIRPSASVSFDLGNTSERWRNVVAQSADLQAGAAVTMSGSIDQLIRKQNTGDLIVRNTVADLVLDDSRRGATVLSGSYNKGIKLAATSGEWSAFSTNFPSIDSLLGALNSLKSAAAASAVKNVVTASGAQAAGADLVAALPIVLPVGYTAANSMAFVNGQLLMSGTQAAVSGGTADYSFDGGAFKLSFALETGDVVTIQKF